MAYTAIMMKIAIILVTFLLPIGCGSNPAKDDANQSALLGEGSFLLRYNPCQCLLHRDELSTEVSLGDRWERVALKDDPNAIGLMRVLMNQMRNQPKALFRVQGELTARLVNWNGKHQSRTLVINKLNPKSSPE